MPPHPKWSDAQVSEMLERMMQGETLTSIASDPNMPSIDTMNRWEAEQETDLGAAITRARDLGFMVRAEKAVERAQTAEDAALGRLSFDADRWFLAHMKPKVFGTLIKHGNADGSNLDVAAAILAGNARVDGNAG